MKKNYEMLYKKLIKYLRDTLDYAKRSENVDVNIKKLLKKDYKSYSLSNEEIINIDFWNYTGCFGIGLRDEIDKEIFEDIIGGKDGNN